MAEKIIRRVSPVTQDQCPVCQGILFEKRKMFHGIGTLPVTEAMDDPVCNDIVTDIVQERYTCHGILPAVAAIAALPEIGKIILCSGHLYAGTIDSKREKTMPAFTLRAGTVESTHGKMEQAPEQFRADAFTRFGERLL